MFAPLSRYFCAMLVLVSALFSRMDALAQEADPLPYAVRGAYVVGIHDFTVEDDEQPLNASMWYPALNPSGREEAYTYDLNGLVTEGRALPAAAPNLTDGPYPVIFYSHGLFGARFESTAYLEHLASWGFVVIAADHSGTTFFNITSAEDVVRSFANRPLEILRLIAHAEALNSEGDYTGLFDTNRLAITGFSFGGYTALLAGGASIDTRALAAACEGVSVEESALCAPTSLDLLAETAGLDAVPEGVWQVVADERIRAIVPLAPCCVEFMGVESLAGVSAPLMVMVGNADEVAPAERNGIVAYDDASSPIKSLVLLDGAGHDLALDIANPNQRQLVNHFATAFFLAHLAQDAGATAALEADATNVDGVEYTTTP